MARAINFNAGPAALPLAALERAQKELLDLAGTGMSVMEHSHRGKAYEAVHNEAIALTRELLCDPGQLRRAAPSGRRQPAVRGRADEPAAAGQERRLHPDRRLVAEGLQRSQDARHGRASPPAPRRTRSSVVSRRRTSSTSMRTPPTPTSPPTTPSSARSGTSSRTPARCRSSPTCRATSSGGRSTSPSSA